MKNIISILPLLFFLALISCKEERPRLVDWSKEFIADGLEVDDTDNEPVMEEYFSVQTKGDTTIATALMLDHCVDEAVAVIECKGKRIYLTTKVTMAAEQYCPIYYKYTYVIYNPGGIDYEIISQ